MDTKIFRDKTRKSLKADLTEAEYEAFTRSHYPSTSVDAVTAIVMWFTQQDDVLRKQILGILPEGFERDIARMALQKFADEGKTRATLASSGEQEQPKPTNPRRRQKG